MKIKYNFLDIISLIDKITEFRLYSKELKVNKSFIKDIYWFQLHKKTKWIGRQNFGDYLATIITSQIAKEFCSTKLHMSNRNKLLTVGSILHFAKDGDIIWGSGVNGKIKESIHRFNFLDVRAVRGPLTQTFLKNRKIECPNVFGDPALLLPKLFPKYKKNTIKNKIIVIPNFNEYKQCKTLIPTNMMLISPLSHWTKVLDEILSSELVLTSSLHGLIFAEAFGVDVKLFKPFGGETMFKYKDYIEGTGRIVSNIPKSFEHKIDENNGLSFPKLQYDDKQLFNSFPYELLK